jgi:hypothetical protein
MNPDTPLPQEEPGGQNPPDGAIIDYYLKEKANGLVTLEIINASGKIIRRFTSNDTAYRIGEVNIPPYWIRPQQILSAAAGSHRFLWDMHYEPLNVPPSYPISAMYRNTSPAPTAPWVMPGNYTVKLTVNGQTYSQTLVIKMDPRVNTSQADLQKQHDLSFICYQRRKEMLTVLNEIASLHQQIRSLSSKAAGEIVSELNDLDKSVSALENKPDTNFNRVYAAFTNVFNILEGTDMPPTLAVSHAVSASEASSDVLITKWMDIKARRVPKINDVLRKAGLNEIELPKE